MSLADVIAYHKKQLETAQRMKSQYENNTPEYPKKILYWGAQVELHSFAVGALEALV